MDYELFWGDAHVNVHPEHMSGLARTFAAAREHLHVFPIAFYPFLWLDQSGLKVESVGQRSGYDALWQEVQKAVADANDPGRFVTFLGYEWHGNRRRFGDHNVYYRNDFEPLSAVPTLPGLYRHLRRHPGIAVPHHTAYRPGERGKDWRHHDPELSPLAEIYSCHGCSEGVLSPTTMDQNTNMGPRVSGGTIVEGLQRGHRFGIIASSDSHDGYPAHWGLGRFGVFALDLSREAVWEAFLARRTIGVTGDRIRLRVTAHGHEMGAAFVHRGAVEMSVQVVGADAIDRIELVRNGLVLDTYCHSGRWSWPRASGAGKWRLEFGWGPNSDKGFPPEEVRFQGTVTVSGGRILSLEPCFTGFGQEARVVSPAAAAFDIVTSQRSGLASGELRPSIVLELRATPASRIAVSVKGMGRYELTWSEARSTAVFAGLRESRERVARYFGVTPRSIDNPDSYWHNARKVLLHRAVPRSAYTVQHTFLDRQPPTGTSFYYVRLSQLNGQLAWSSPIWVANTR